MTVRHGFKSRHRDANGFTLIEMLVALAVLALIAVAVAGISISFLMQVSDGSRDRQADATTAQWASMSFARDVQGAAGIAAECAPGSGTRLITFRPSGTGPSIEYRVTSADGAFRIDRVGCGSGVPAHSLTSGLQIVPTVSCDGSPCLEGTNPRLVTLHVARSSSFEFKLDGVRRTTDGNVDPATVPREVPPFVSLGGSAPLSISGAGKLTVVGDAYINNPGSTAVTISGSASLSVGKDLLVQNGPVPGPVLVATGNPQLHVGGNGPALSEMNACGWCDIRIDGSGPGTFDSIFPDPNRFLPVPDTSGLTTQSSCTLQAGFYVCRPGIYTSPFPPGGGGDAKFKLEPGTYILRGGFLVQNARTVQSNSGGVLLYIESGAVTVQGDAKLTLGAQTSGTYAGFLFFQPKSNTAPFSIANGGEISALDGSIYAPGASSVNLSSGAGRLTIKQVIGRNISIADSGEVVVGGN